MEGTLRLYDTLERILSQHRNWLDLRHLQTLAWMMVGLIHSGRISLSAWAPYVHSRATYLQSSVRRFARWLNDPRIHVHDLYGPLIRGALHHWGDHTLYLALDTTTLWGAYCVVRISVIYRGRAIPLVWRVLERQSTSVALGVYRDLLDWLAAACRRSSGATGRPRFRRCEADGPSAQARVALDHPHQTELLGLRPGALPRAGEVDPPGPRTGQAVASRVDHTATLRASPPGLGRSRRELMVSPQR